MGGCHPTRILRAEHELILQVIGAFEAILDGPPDEAAVDDVERCVGFFRLFVDACHHGKEEDLLFEALVEQGLPREEGPVAVMLEEHRAGRSQVRTIAGLLDAVRGGEPGAWSRLADAGRAYVELMRGHILKEDGALFEMADSAIEGAQCRRLCDAYDAVCARRYEGRALRDLERIAQTLIERHGR